MDIFQLLQGTAGFISDYANVLLIVCFVVLLILYFRKSSKNYSEDYADKLFIRAGLNVGGQRVQVLREVLAKIVEDTERKRFVETMQQQADLDAIQVEKDRKVHLVRSSPLIIKEVGAALQAVEKEFKRSSQLTQSEKAREVLRLTAEKEINNILASVDDTVHQVPPFWIRENGQQPTIKVPRNHKQNEVSAK